MTVRREIQHDARRPGVLGGRDRPNQRGAGDRRNAGAYGRAEGRGRRSVSSWHDSCTAGTDGETDRHLAAADDRTREQQVGDVRAGDQEHDADHRHQQVQRLAELRADRAGARCARCDVERFEQGSSAGFRRGRRREAGRDESGPDRQTRAVGRRRPVHRPRENPQPAPPPEHAGPLGLQLRQRAERLRGSARSPTVPLNPGGLTPTTVTGTPSTSNGCPIVGASRGRRLQWLSVMTATGAAPSRSSPGARPAGNGREPQRGVEPAADPCSAGRLGRVWRSDGRACAVESPRPTNSSRCPEPLHRRVVEALARRTVPHAQER